MIYRIRLATLVLTLVAFLPAACEGPLPQDDAEQSPTPSGDVRERVAAALQQPGKVTEIRVLIREPSESEGQDDVIRSWMDLPGERLRVEQMRGEEATSISVLADGVEAFYIRDGDIFDEHPTGIDWDYWVSEFGVDVPPFLRNHALRGIHPFTAALLFGGWTPAGTGEWQGRPATLWEADHPGPDGDMHTYTTIYLDAETYLPVGQELRYAQRKGEPPEGHTRVAYEIEFVPTNAIPPETFDIAELRKLRAEFGGKLDEAKAQGYAVLWLGAATNFGEAYPEIPLASVYLRRTGEPDGPYAAFHYRNTSGPVDHQGEVSVVARPSTAWDAFSTGHGEEQAWWRDPAVQRQPIVIEGVEGDYAIGRQSGSRARARSTELVIWLPDSVVRVTASPMLVPTSTPTPSPSGTPPIARVPDFENAVDINPFNTHEAMEQIAQALTVLR